MCKHTWNHSNLTNYITVNIRLLEPGGGGGEARGRGLSNHSVFWKQKILKFIYLFSQKLLWLDDFVPRFETE